MIHSFMIKKGQVLVYRIFDLSEEIDLKRAETLLKKSRGPERFRVPKHIDRALLVKTPPVRFDYSTDVIHIREQAIKVETQAKLRDYGVLTLIYQIQIPEGFSWEQLIQLASLLETGDSIDLLAERHQAEIKTTISEALKKPNSWKGFEDYIVYFIEEFENGVRLNEVIQKEDVTALLFAENEVKISEVNKKSVLENVMQYGEKDLVLVDWNAALVVEPGGGKEVCDILEIAISHLNVYLLCFRK